MHPHRGAPQWRAAPSEPTEPVCRKRAAWAVGTGRRSRVTRWFFLFLGLLIIAGTLYLVVPEETPHVSAGPPREFDALSRARLEKVLQEAEGESVLR